MIVAIHQPNFLPYPGYFHKMIHCDHFVYLDHVQYTSGGADAVTNRNKIKTPNGEFALTVPVLKQSGPNINQIIIDYKQDWVDKMKKTIDLAYKKSSAYQDIAALLYPILDQKNEHLKTLNINIIDAFRQYLSIQTPTSISSEMNIDPQLQKDDLLIEIVKRLGGSTYLSGKGGLKYMQLDKYADHQIEVTFNQYEYKVYPQAGKDFIPNLSMLDLMFHTGKQAVNYL